MRTKSQGSERVSPRPTNEGNFFNNVVDKLSEAMSKLSDNCKSHLNHTDHSVPYYENKISS